MVEKLEADGKIYHKHCFRCAECNKTIGLVCYAALNGKIYCKPHFKQLFKLKGNYSEGNSASMGAEMHFRLILTRAITLSHIRQALVRSSIRRNGPHPNDNDTKKWALWRDDAHPSGVMLTIE